MSDQGIALADLIDAVRSELRIAADRAARARLRFEVQEVELNVEITTTVTDEASGGIKVYVLNVGGRTSAADTAAHKVRIKLGAFTPEGKNFEVRDEAGEIERR